ncbi:hypothetical protein F2Q69_00058847 [Brassica cretica]|uniref:Uncharacterized protein n=1 Tax=Brassica cretica TaxID=69181 RepID=A0A8S9RJ65_BRACR|nr:hypothetical protein F2Q69_00058847 [Brassica cretica]
MVAIVILRQNENGACMTRMVICVMQQVHAQQYQKQQGQTPAILRRSCSLGTHDPQRPTFHIARRSSFYVD